MNITVYRQAKKVRPDGTTVFKGEDARPYVDGQTILIADGMGGAAAIRHQKFVPELFQPDTLLDALFAGVYEDYSDPRFVEYVTASFAELFAVKDCYTANVNNMKKGGYFASRLVTAIILHGVLYDPAVSAETLFAGLHQAREEDREQEYLQSLGQQFKERIQTQLRQIAANANLVYESSYSGLALLGTTLTLTIYLEDEEQVEAIYLTAGDSRPYSWNETEGLCQAQRDQEGTDGTMTNYIRANEDADFRIDCACATYRKPCILFSASDGCFDSEYFISQMAFEKLLLDTIVAQPDTEAVGQELERIFDQYGRHDDSSTIALRTFGYESYEALQQSAQTRLDAMEEQYFSRLPDLLRLNYMAGYAQAEKDFPKRMAALKAKFEEQEQVIRYCVDRIPEGVYPPYQEKLEQIRRQDEQLREYLDEARRKAIELISANFAAFVPYVNLPLDWMDRRNADQIQRLSDGYCEAAEDYTFRIRHYSEDLQSNIDSITALLREIYDVGVPEGFEDYDEDSFRVVDDCERSMDDLFSFFKGLKTHKLEVVRRISHQRREYVQQNMRWAEKHPTALADIWDMLENGDIDLDTVNMLSEERKKLQAQIDLYHDIDARRKDLRENAEPKARMESAREWWDGHFGDIIPQILESDVELPEELREEARLVAQETAIQLAALKEKRDLQVQMLQEYDRGYYRYVGGIEE